MKKAESIFLACLVSQLVAEDNVFFDRCCKEGNPTPQPASLPAPASLISSLSRRFTSPRIQSLKASQGFSYSFLIIW